jgi:uncharacterized membrane protein
MNGVRLDVTAPSSTGLDPSIAAALAYLAGPFSGVVILLAERTNAFVRFHAWQSIIGLGGLGAIVVGLLFLAFVALLLFSPLLFTWLYRLAAVATVAWVVAWAFCLVKAFSGYAWKLPYAGTAAMKRPAALRHVNSELRNLQLPNRETATAPVGYFVRYAARNENLHCCQRAAYGSARHGRARRSGAARGPASDGVRGSGGRSPRPVREAARNENSHRCGRAA